jgi:hypothetical protein
MTYRVADAIEESIKAYKWMGSDFVWDWATAIESDFPRQGEAIRKVAREAIKAHASWEDSHSLAKDVSCPWVGWLTVMQAMAVTGEDVSTCGWFKSVREELLEKMTSTPVSAPMNYGLPDDEQPDQSGQWYALTLRHRDSPLYDEVDAEELVKRLEAIEWFEPFWTSERIGHGAVGWVDMLYFKGNYIEPPAGTAILHWIVCQFAEKSDSYTLNDELFYERQYEQAVTDIVNYGGPYVRDDAPKDWTEQVYMRMTDTLDHGQDGYYYIDEDDVINAMYELGFAEEEEDDEGVTENPPKSELLASAKQDHRDYTVIQSRLDGKNTLRYTLDDGREIVRYWYTDVVTIWPEFQDIELDSGGHNTNTTRRRMDRELPGGVEIWGEPGTGMFGFIGNRPEWSLPYFDGIIITRAGLPLLSSVLKNKEATLALASNSYLRDRLTDEELVQLDVALMRYQNPGEVG